MIPLGPLLKQLAQHFGIDQTFYFQLTNAKLEIQKET